MPRRRLLILAAVAVGVAGALPWPVTAPVQWFLDRSGKGTGLAPAVERAVWVPWRSLDLTGLRVDPPVPGSVRAEKVRLVPDWPRLALGQVRADCLFEEVEWDPAGEQAVRVDGTGAVHLEWGAAVLERLSLEGPAMRLEAEGWLRSGREARLRLDGALSRDFIQDMGWMGPGESAGEGWESFRLRLEGAFERPQVQFTSRFFTFSMNLPAEVSS
ncbi:MAG: hypothetical protein HYZ94_03785 [Candidatus Omnitrophica bacterium]|nr:hypothetical protein [Candidatus Omnitrophota bacterium]